MISRKGQRGGRGGVGGPSKCDPGKGEARQTRPDDRLDPDAAADRRREWDADRRDLVCENAPNADPDWGAVCETAAEGVMDPAVLRERAAAKANFLRSLPATARRLGVAERVIEVACARHEEAARGAKAAVRGLP
jgi:hypothetical protein